MPGRQSQSRTTSKSSRITDFDVTSFSGLNTAIKDLKTFPRGLSPDSLNWMTGQEGDHIELRRGQELLGSTRITTSGHISGLGIGTKLDGTQIPFFTYGRKLKYYDVVSDDTVEVGTDYLPLASASDDFSFLPYTNLAGSFIYLTSKNSSIYKIPTANPGSPVDQSITDYRGKIGPADNRVVVWGTKTSNNIENHNNIFLSHTDKALYTSYTQVSAEAVGSGNGSNKSFTGTLAAKASGTKRTCFAVSITDSVETFYDDGNGILTGTVS